MPVRAGDGSVGDGRVRERSAAAPRAEALRADALLRWYAGSARDLPWRRTRDPYALLVSEVMLQQTQAARVVPRYERFLARFPDVGALAAAPVRDVLEEWSGLGYNRRALALRGAAREVAARGWPADLTTLPGVAATPRRRSPPSPGASSGRLST